VSRAGCGWAATRPRGRARFMRAGPRLDFLRGLEGFLDWHLM
jgi:hypothetical protein